MRKIKNNHASNLMIGFALMSAISTLAACTRSIPYKALDDKEKVQTKNDVDTTSEFLYVASSDLSNHESLEASGSRPYWQGSESIVKFRFTEKALEAYAVEEDSRLKSNRTNERLVMQIPIDHIDYRCAEDTQGKCTNKEELNTKAAWNQKTKFKPDLSQAKVVEASLLPVEMDKIFGSSCYEEVASNLLDYEITPDAINIRYLKSYKGNVECLSKAGASVGKLTSLQTQIIFHHSFVKLNKMASPGYKAVDYPRKDENAFGYFTTENRKYDVDFNRTENLNKEYLNRWSPEKKEITYYLSENFNKPEFKAIRAATYASFEKVNAGLAKAGVNFRLTLKDGTGKLPGDIRNSMIVLVEDPIASGPLGYGPTVANPRTGEIMSGRVVMYYGNFLQNIRYIYDEVLREHKKQKSTSSIENKDNSELAKDSTQPALQSERGLLARLALKNNSATDKTAAKMLASLNKMQAQSKQDNKLSVNKLNSQFISQSALDLSKLNSRGFQKEMLTSNRQMGTDVLSVMSKYCNYPAELFPFDEIIAKSLESKLKAAKEWKDMNDKEKQEVIDILMAEAWVPTLVHELGHNLGFRHNFAGSEDKNNFYTQSELKDMGVNHQIPYSSVMDYGYSELNLLPTLGKYDVAALKFAYNRQVEDTKGNWHQIETTLKDLDQKLNKDVVPGEPKNVEFKDYAYCSDEHVDVNPNCKRFDRGTNNVEIVNYLIQSYHEMYARRNFRNGLENFSKVSDGKYYQARMANFNYIRAFFERYESIKNRFGLKDDIEEWKTVPFLKELKEAAIISGRFFIDVLKTPDLICLVAAKDKPNQPVGALPLKNISREGMSCFKDAQLNPKFMVIGQAGKSLNDLKDPDSDNAYADQIDVRGIYADKLAAARSLFARKTGNYSYDKTEGNYLDLPELNQEVTQLVSQMMIPNRVENLEYTLIDGSKAKVTTPIVDFQAPEENDKSLPLGWIDAPISESVAKTIGLPTSAVSFQEKLMNILKANSNSTSSHYLDNSLLNSVSLFIYPITEKAEITTDIDGKNTASPKLILNGYQYIAGPENHLAAEYINFIKKIKTIEDVPREQLSQYVEKRKSKQSLLQGNNDPGLKKDDGKSENINLEAKIASDLDKIDLSMIEAYLQGSLPSKAAITYLLRILPRM